MNIGSQGNGFDMGLNCLHHPRPFLRGEGGLSLRRAGEGCCQSSKNCSRNILLTPHPSPLPLKMGEGSGIRMVLTFKPLAANLSFIWGLEPADGRRRGLFELVTTKAAKRPEVAA